MTSCKPLPKSLIAAAFCALLITGAGGAFAHSTKEMTVPADGASLSEPPAVVAMEFDAPMRVTTISLTSSSGDTIGFEESTGPAPVKRYEAVPPMLDPGRYEVEWRGLSSDGHTMEGSFGFTVE
jgi:hypothetical protein